MGDVSGQESIGAALARLRREQGRTGAFVAGEMIFEGHAWTRATVSAVESDRRRVSIPELASLCAIMGVAVDQLVPDHVAAAFAGHGIAAPDEEVEALLREERGRQLERVVAGRLGVSVTTVSDLAEVQYGMSLVDYRDHRVVESAAKRRDAELEANPWAPEPRGVDDRAIQERGHVTRQIIQELAELLSYRNEI